MSEITHDRLVRAATAWLGKQHRIVASELQTMTAGENPDAIGWRGLGQCTVIECKASRADFRANAKKYHERAGMGVGDRRWFMTPPGLVQPEEVPGGWGLMEFTPSGHRNGYFIRKRVDAPSRPQNETARGEERRMLIAIAARSMEAAHKLKAVWLGEETPTPEERKPTDSGADGGDDE